MSPGRKNERTCPFSSAHHALTCGIGRIGIGIASVQPYSWDRLENSFLPHGQVPEGGTRSRTTPAEIVDVIRVRTAPSMLSLLRKSGKESSVPPLRQLHIGAACAAVDWGVFLLSPVVKRIGRENAVGPSRLVMKSKRQAAGKYTSASQHAADWAPCSGGDSPVYLPTCPVLLLHTPGLHAKQSIFRQCSPFPPKGELRSVSKRYRAIGVRCHRRTRFWSQRPSQPAFRPTASTASACAQSVRQRT